MAIYLQHNVRGMIAEISKVSVGGKLHNYFRRCYMCNYCTQRAEIHACNNCRLSNVLESIQDAKVLQPMTAFGEIT